MSGHIFRKGNTTVLKDGTTGTLGQQKSRQRGSTLPLTGWINPSEFAPRSTWQTPAKRATISLAAFARKVRYMSVHGLPGEANAEAQAPSRSNRIALLLNKAELKSVELGDSWRRFTARGARTLWLNKRDSRRAGASFYTPLGRADRHSLGDSDSGPADMDAAWRGTVRKKAREARDPSDIGDHTDSDIADDDDSAGAPRATSSRVSPRRTNGSRESADVDVTGEPLHEQTVESSRISTESMQPERSQRLRPPWTGASDADLQVGLHVSKRTISVTRVRHIPGGGPQYSIQRRSMPRSGSVPSVTLSEDALERLSAIAERVRKRAHKQRLRRPRRAASAATFCTQGEGDSNTRNSGVKVKTLGANTGVGAFDAQRIGFPRLGLGATNASQTVPSERGADAQSGRSSRSSAISTEKGLPLLPRPHSAFWKVQVTNVEGFRGTLHGWLRAILPHLSRKAVRTALQRGQLAVLGANEELRPFVEAQRRLVRRFPESSELSEEEDALRDAIPPVSTWTSVHRLAVKQSLTNAARSFTLVQNDFVLLPLAWQDRTALLAAQQRDRNQATFDPFDLSTVAPSAIQPSVLLGRKNGLSTTDLSEYHARVLYYDAGCIVWNKPAHWSCAKDGKKLCAALTLDGQRPRIVRPLDAGVTGCLILSRTETAHNVLDHALRTESKGSLVMKDERTPSRVFWGITTWKPFPTHGRITQPLRLVPNPKGEGSMLIPVESETNAKLFNMPASLVTVYGRNDPKELKPKRATTEYRVVDSVGASLAWVAFYPTSPSCAQVRIHTQHTLGCPILGDTMTASLDARWATHHLAAVPLLETVVKPGQTLQQARSNPIPRLCSVAPEDRIVYDQPMHYHSTEWMSRLHLYLHCRKVELPWSAHAMGEGMKSLFGGEKVTVTAPLPPHMEALFEYFSWNVETDDPYVGPEWDHSRDREEAEASAYSVLKV